MKTERKMKKNFLLMMGVLCSVVFFASCEKNNTELGKTFDVKVKLCYPDGSPIGVSEGVEIKMVNTKGSVYTYLTDADGVALFNVPESARETVSSKLKALTLQTHYGKRTQS